MKLNARTSADFLAKPDKQCHACLVYGPDDGLVQEQCKVIRKAVLGEHADDFAFVEMDAPRILEDASVLTDELRTVHMLADKRLVFIRGATDKLLKSIENSEQHWHKAAFLLVAAGELTPRSSLRKWFEAGSKAAALPCYHDDARSIRQLVQQTFAKEGVQADGQTIDFLSQQFGNDRRVTLSELEKICLFAGQNKRLSLNDAKQLVEYNRESQFDDMAASVAERKLAALEKELSQALEEKLSPVMYIRILHRYFSRLYTVRAKMDEGESIATAMKQLRPPIFFKEEERFARHVRAWDAPSIALVQQRLVQAERACKTSDLPPHPASSRVLFQATQTRAKP